MMGAELTDQAFTDLVLQTGPLGTLVVILGGLVRAWLKEIKSDMAAMKGQLEQHAKKDGELDLEVRDQRRRLDTLERIKAGGS